MLAPLVTLWLILVQLSVFRAIVPCGIVIALCSLFGRRALNFTRYDVVLVPTFLATLLAVIDITTLTSYDCVVIATIVTIAAAWGTVGTAR